MDVELSPLNLDDPGYGRKENRGYGSVRRCLVNWAPKYCPYIEIQKQRRAGFCTVSMTVFLHIHDSKLDEDDICDPCHGC